MMTGKISWVSGLIKSNKGGVFRIITLDLLDADVAKAQVYLDPENGNYARWAPLLAVDNILSGLVWNNRAKKLIDGDSPVELR